MSNRRRPQRRDAHGAPVRTRQELWTAIATGAGVLLVTVLLLIWLQNDGPSSPATTTSPSTQANSTGSTITTTALPNGNSSSTTGGTPATTGALTPVTSTGTVPVVSTTKP